MLLRRAGTPLHGRECTLRRCCTGASYEIELCYTSFVHGVSGAHQVASQSCGRRSAGWSTVSLSLSFGFPVGTVTAGNKDMEIEARNWPTCMCTLPGSLSSFIRLDRRRELAAACMVARFLQWRMMLRSGRPNRLPRRYHHPCPLYFPPFYWVEYISCSWDGKYSNAGSEPTAPPYGL